MVAVNAMQEVVDAGEHAFDAECMPPPPDQFHLQSEEDEETNQPGPSNPNQSPDAQVTNMIPPAATSDVASKESLSGRITFLRV